MKSFLRGMALGAAIVSGCVGILVLCLGLGFLGFMLTGSGLGIATGIAIGLLIVFGILNVLDESGIL